MTVKNESRKILKSVFGFEQYHNELQEKAVEAILEAKRDVFIRGFGKSLCYQLPVLLKDNCFIIVVSQRTEYIKRYHKFFKSKNIKTEYLTSSTSRNTRIHIEKDILSETSSFKILFITPIKYESGYFKSILKQINKQRLCYIVIDNSDSIIAERENIRRPYENLDLKIVRVPIIALSATADSEAQQNIIKKFRLLNPKMYVMSVLRTNLYQDTWYINTLPDPLAHLRKFIENCSSCNGDATVEERGTWGMIVCKDLETTISIAKYLRLTGIAALPHTAINNNKQLEHLKDIKVITTSDEVGMLTVTNSPNQVITRKLVRFIVYWYTTPEIKKYYFQLSFARYIYGMCYCRIYCQLEDLINNDAQYYDELSPDALSYCSVNKSLTDIKTSSLQLECRHKAYSEYCGDTFYMCKDFCDVCKERKGVVERMNVLLQSIDNEYLKKKLKEALELTKDCGRISHEKLQYKRSKETFSSQYQIKNLKYKGTRVSNADKHNLDTSIQNIEKSIDKLDEKSLPKSSKVKVYSESQTKDTENQKAKRNNIHPSSQVSSESSRKLVSSGYQTINIEKTTKKKINDNHFSSDTSIQFIEENNDKLYKKSQAILALDKTYKALFNTQTCNSTSKLTLTELFNVKTVSSTSQVSDNKSKKYNNRNPETKTTIEVITIDDESSGTEEGFVQNETVPNSDSNDDDIIFIKESRKRRRSQDSTSQKKKLRK